MNEFMSKPQQLVTIKPIR